MMNKFRRTKRFSGLAILVFPFTRLSAFLACVSYSVDSSIGKFVNFQPSGFRGWRFCFALEKSFYARERIFLPGVIFLRAGKLNNAEI